MYKSNENVSQPAVRLYLSLQLAETCLRRQQFLSSSINSSHFTKAERSLPYTWRRPTSCHKFWALIYSNLSFSRTWFVPKLSVLIFLSTNWQRSTSLIYIGTLVVTLAACPYLFQLDWLNQSCATAVCVWSCLLTSLPLRCRKISNNGTLSNYVWNPTNLPQWHLLL